MNLFQRIWDYFENIYLESKYPTVFEIVFVLILSTISYLAVLIKFITLFSEEINIIYKILLISLFLTLIIIVTYLIRRLREFRYDILQRNSFIEFIANEYDPKYQIEKIEDVHEIKNNGDGYFKRTVHLEYIGETVPWYEMSMGNTQNRIENKRKKIRVYNAEDPKIRLSHLPFKNNGDKIHHAIILQPILSPDSPKSNLVVTKEWKQVWEQLVKTHDDNGILKFKVFTKDFEIKFILPKLYEFINHEINPKIGKWYSNEFDQQSRQCLSLKAKNIEPGVYRYKISIRQKRKNI
jgi:hypothetical protein